MIIKFRIISEEKEDFVRDIEIYANNTFYELHLAIQEACNYDSGLLSSFFVANDKWEKEQEIILEKMDVESQKDVLLMEDVVISEFAKKLKQKFIYIYDFFSVRSFFIEIVNIRKEDKEDKKISYPICTLQKSTPPKQIFIDDIKNLDVDNPDFEDVDDFDDIGYDDFDDY